MEGEGVQRLLHGNYMQNLLDAGFNHWHCIAFTSDIYSVFGLYLQQKFYLEYLNKTNATYAQNLVNICISACYYCLFSATRRRGTVTGR